jgi:large subunit ribosomal protein L25
MEKISLQKRDLTGKKAKRLLNEGLLPAVLYNSKKESQNVKLTISEAAKLLNEATLKTIIDIELDGKEKKAIIKDVDTDPRTDEVRHISFFEIDEKQPMVFEIPFELVGVSPAVKNNLGVLVNILPTLEVRCKVADLVDSIKVDISKLEFPGQTIAVEDVEIPEGISFINEDIKTSPIVTITQLQKEEEIEEVVEETEEGEEVTEGEEGAETEEGSAEETPEEKEE